MCFIDHSDWYADIYDRSSKPAERPVRCDECHELIGAGQLCHTVFMQQYECCLRCGRAGPDSSDPEDRCCCADGPNYGEQYDYLSCDNCYRFLEAVESAELAAGCRPHESRPHLGSLLDELGDLGPGHVRNYLLTARQKYPDLKPYLGRLWKRLFVHARSTA